MSTINYQGDPKLYIDKNGAYLDFRGGQPIMDQGFENAALISLFTKKGWHGNAFLSEDEKIGSDFQKTATGTITASSIENINQEAIKALDKPFFGDVSAETSNPINYRINTDILIRPPGYDSGVIQLEKNGENWIFQKNNPPPNLPPSPYIPPVPLSGDIVALDTDEHDTANGIYNTLAQIDETHFILAYNSGSNNYIKTFEVDSEGAITELDDHLHGTTALRQSIVKIDDTHFALAFTTGATTLYIKIFEIDGAYAISETSSFLTGYSGGVSIGAVSLVLIDPGYLALAYGDSFSDGNIATFAVNGSYVVSNIDNVEHDTSDGIYNSLVVIDSTHLALAYSGTNDNGFIKTFSIDGAYDNITELKSLEHDTDNGTYNSLVVVDSTHLILAYSGDTGDGFIKTFALDGSYDITELKSLEHDTGIALENSLVKIDDTHFALSFDGLGASPRSGIIKTFEIDGSYDIEEKESLVFEDNLTISYVSSIAIGGNIVVTAYSGTDADGFVKTFLIE